MRAVIASATLLLLGCGTSASSDPGEIYELPESTRTTDFTMVGAASDGAVILLAPSPGQTGIVVIDRRRKDVRIDMGGTLVSNAGSWLRTMDNSVREVVSGKVVRFPSSGAASPRLYSATDSWLVRSSGEGPEARLSAVATDGRSWEISLALPAHDSAKAVACSATAGRVALLAPGQHAQDQDEVTIRSLDAGTLVARWTLPNLRSSTLVYSDDGTTVMVEQDAGPVLVDAESGKILAKGSGSVPGMTGQAGTRAHLSARDFWSFDYEHTVGGGNHLSAETYDFDHCEFGRARLGGKTFRVSDRDGKAVLRSLGQAEFPSTRCRMRGVVQSERGPLAVVVDSRRGRVRLVPIP